MSEWLDIFVNDLGKMGVNLVVVEDTKLLRQPSFLVHFALACSVAKDSYKL